MRLKKILGIVGIIALVIFMLSIWIQNYYFVSEIKQEGLVLEVWNKPPSRQVKERKLWKEMVLRFQQQYPQIKVKGIEREFSPQEFITAMAGGKGPDVMHVWIGSLPILARQGFIVPLDKNVDTWDQKDYIPDIVWQPTRIDNKTYGIPKDTYFMVLFYRKDLFTAVGLDPEKPPKNWEELIQYAKLLTQPEKNIYGFGMAPSTWNFMDLVWQNGGELVKKNSQDKWEANFDSPTVIEALQFLRDLKWKHKVLPPNDLVTTEEVAQMFALGRIGMMMGVAMQLPKLINKYGLNIEDMGIAPLPAGPAGIRASHAGGEVYVVNAAIPKARQEAAWNFIEFELSPANQLWKWIRMKELGMTIFPGAFATSTELLNMPEFAMVKEEVKYVRNEPHFPEWLLIKDALDNDPLQAVFIKPDMDLEKYMKKFKHRIEQKILQK